MTTKLVIEKEPIKLGKVSDLKIGQLAKIKDDGIYNGAIVVKCYNSIVCVHSVNPKVYSAFHSTWSGEGITNFQCEILPSNYKIVISNEE